MMSTAVDLYHALKAHVALPDNVTGLEIVARVGEPIRLIVTAILPPEAVEAVAAVVGGAAEADPDTVVVHEVRLP